MPASQTWQGKQSHRRPRSKIEPEKDGELLIGKLIETLAERHQSNFTPKEIYMKIKTCYSYKFGCCTFWLF